MAAARRGRLAWRLVSTGNRVPFTFSKSRTGRRLPSGSRPAGRRALGFYALTRVGELEAKKLERLVNSETGTWPTRSRAQSRLVTGATFSAPRREVGGGR